MLILLFFAFFSGLVTIFAPCIWPILPIVLSFSTLGKSHMRPLGITIGVMLSFSFFTLAVFYLVMLFHLDPNLLRGLAAILLVFLGLSMIISSWTNFLESLASSLTRFFGGKIPKRNDFLGGFFAGISLGILWSPCAGPILATVATLSIAGQVSLSVIFITLAYSLGVGIPLFIFAYGGQRIFIKTRFLSPHTGTAQKLLGVFTILVALSIYTNYDKLIQARLLDLLPQYTQIITQFESSDQVKKQLDALKGQSGEVPVSKNSSSHGPAPEFSGITNWLNVDKPLTIKDLRGKVVLIDFWTYTCINCIRTLPHVTGWYEKYKNKGFVVVGVHTPEFEFEKNTDNVKQAIQEYMIHYPVAQDNDHKTWNAYSNQYWPAEYLIDSYGVIQEEHFGEGNYDETEKKIQTLLEDAGKTVANTTLQMPDDSPKGSVSPETYLGSDRMEYFFPQGSYPAGAYTFSQNTIIPQGTFSFAGDWTISPQQAISGKNATLLLHFTAQKVFLVMRPPKRAKGAVTLDLDGQALDAKIAGVDVKDGVISVDQDRLYNLIDLKGKIGEHTLLLRFQTPGVECFAFTFG